MSAAPQPVFHTPASVRRSRDGGTDASWLLGWLALAVVVGLMILGLVWIGVNAYDRFQSDTVVASAERTHLAAAASFRKGAYEEALNGYLEAARQSRGDRQLVARKNAAHAAVALGEQFLKTDPAKAESHAMQARDLNPDLPAAYVLLGRAIGKRGRVDEAVTTLDYALDAARRAQPTATPDENKQNQKVIGTVPLWKADALYQDGVALMDRNPDGARQRFEAVIAAAPNSDFARNARTFLDRLRTGQPGADPSGMAPAYPNLGSLTDPSSSPAGQPPTGWNPNSYGLGTGR